MASYEAVINLVVQGEAALNRIQKKIDNLYKTVGDLETKKKFQGSQAAASFVREQANELERVVSVSKKQIKEQERSIVRQSKLNAAVDLYERRQRQLSRTSVANQKQFASQIKDIEEGFKFFRDRKSATGVQAIATELGRIIEYDNEINRISERRTTNQRRLFAFSKEIAKYESFGLKTDRARKTLSNFEQVAGSNQLKKAQEYESALRNQLRLLKDQLTEQKRVSGLAPRSPVLGGAGFPGSPRAVAAQQRAQEAALRQAQRGFPASPIGGTATMLGSPKFLAAQERARSAAERALRAQERSAKAAESAANKEADRVLKESQKGFPSSPIMGIATMAGSPKAIAAQERNRAAAERRAAAQRRAEERAAKVQQQVAVAAERAADKALKEAQKGFPSSPILGSSTLGSSPRWKAAQESARQKLESAARAAERAADRALKEAQKGFPSSPILGTATMTGSPRWKAAQERMSRMARGGANKESGFRPALTSAEVKAQINEIVTDFNAVAPKAGSAGDNIASTFATELKQGASRAASSAKSFATAATEAINKVFGIASPSRFMIELVQNLVNTYIAEMQKSYPRIQAATDKAFGEQTLLRNVKELRATNRGFEFGERPSRGFRPFREAQGFGRGTEGATQEFSNMMLDFRKQIAELTTQPEIFSNLLRGLPDSRITTDLVGAANRRALASELPSFMPTQRMMGSGELEKIIISAFADYFRTIRTPNPWVGAVGDYREFIDKVIAQTKELNTQQKLLTGARVAGVLPPSSRGSRIAEAYRRSEERGRAVMAEGSFSSAQFALPPAGPRTLADSINDLFARISSAVSSSFGGFGGGGRRGGGGGGAAGAGGPQNIEDLQRSLGLRDLGPIARATGEQIDELTARLSELRKRIDPTTQDFAELTKQLGVLGREQERRAPDAGFLTRRFGPRGGRAVSEGLVGGAFPLLFGQGLGAAVGGGAGGALGGFAGGGLGFGLSLAGTALGTAFDTLNQAAQETGKALRYPVDAFEQLKDAGLIATRQQEYYIQKLIESGRMAEAAAEIQSEVIKKIGVQGVKDLQQLGDSSSRLSKAWAEFNLQLQAALAGPMADLLDWVGGIVSEINRTNRQTAELRDFMQSLTPQQQQEYFRRSIELRNQNNGAVDPAAIQRLQREFLPNGVQQPQAALTQEQLDAQKQAQAVTQELQAQVALQAKQLSLTGLTLERDGARYVNATRAVALQEYDNKLLEIKNGWIGKIFNAEQNLAQIRGANLELAAKLRQINEEIARRQEELYMSGLQAEAALYDQRQRTIDLLVRIAAFSEGEEAGLNKQLSLMDNLYMQRLAAYEVEKEIALIEASRNGTTQQVLTLFDERLKQLNNEHALEEGITNQKLAQIQLNRFIAAEEAKRQAADPFVQFRKAQELDQQYAQTYFRLLREGVIPAEAERLASFQKLVSERLSAIDSEIAFNQILLDEAINAKAGADRINELTTAIENLKAARGVTEQQALEGAGPAPQEIPGAKIQEFISTAEQELKDLESVAIRVSQGIGDAVGNSITSGISGLVEGTATAKEVFAGFLKDIGQILLQEAAKMIATYVAIGIARMFAGFAAGASSGGSSTAIPSTGTPAAPTINGFDTGSIANIAANGAYFDGGMSYFANGGIVSSPTLFQFADGGIAQTGLMGEAGPEAIMPLKRGPDGKLGVAAKLDGAMGRYRRSPGSAGGPGGGSATAEMAAGGVATMQPIDVRYSVERINNVDYVTADQFRAGMAQAAQQGAAQGERRALRTLQNSAATRKRIGV